MRVECVMFRDPDSNTDLHVYIDGVLINEPEVWDFDPGAGQCRDDVLEFREDMRKGDASPAVKEKCEEGYAMMLESAYTD